MDIKQLIRKILRTGSAARKRGCIYARCAFVLNSFRHRGARARCETQFNLDSHDVACMKDFGVERGAISNSEHRLADQAYSIEKKDWNRGDAC